MLAFSFCKDGSGLHFPFWHACWQPRLVLGFTLSIHCWSQWKSQCQHFTLNQIL